MIGPLYRTKRTMTKPKTCQVAPAEGQPTVDFHGYRTYAFILLLAVAMVAGSTAAGATPSADNPVRTLIQQPKTLLPSFSFSLGADFLLLTHSPAIVVLYPFTFQNNMRAQPGRIGAHVRHLAGSADPRTKLTDDCSVLDQRATNPILQMAGRPHLFGRTTTDVSPAMNT